MKKTHQVLIIGYVWPEPDSSAAGSRMMQLLSLFRKMQWEVTFASPASESKYMADLEDLGVKRVSININSSGFDKLLEQLDPTLVLFDRFVTEEQFGWRVARQCPGAVRILDTEDLHCLRRTREKAVRDGKQFSETDMLDQDIARREIASIFRSDLSLIISEAEMHLLENLFSVDSFLLHYLPFLLEPLSDEVVRLWPGYSDREHFVTIGNFRHTPNVDAVNFLKNEIWPHIRKKLPEARIDIFGAYPGKAIKQLHNPEEGFHIEGRIENAEEAVRRARVCLAPLRFGAGLKGKLVEAMQCGTPSVTTTVGAEGITGQMGWPGAVTDQPQKFAENAVKLYKDEKKWIEAQKQGKEIINRRFSGKRRGKNFIQRVEEVSQSLIEHRQRNFIGSMLRHHTMASTKFMSKWIETKNTLENI